MYKIKMDGITKDALRRGDTKLLITLLERSNENIIRELKVPGSNTAFLQGASLITDTLLRMYKDV